MSLDLDKIDRLIAEHVLGWGEISCASMTCYKTTCNESNCCIWAGEGADEPFDYKLDEFKPTRDIAAAWKVVEKLKLYLGPTYHEDDDTFERTELWEATKSLGDLSCGMGSKATTAPLAICLAALKLKGIKYD